MHAKPSYVNSNCEFRNETNYNYKLSFWFSEIHFTTGLLYYEFTNAMLNVCEYLTERVCSANVSLSSFHMVDQRICVNCGPNFYKFWCAKLVNGLTILFYSACESSVLRNVYDIIHLWYILRIKAFPYFTVQQRSLLFCLLHGDRYENICIIIQSNYLTIPFWL